NQSCSIALLNRAAKAWSRSSARGWAARYSDSSRISARSCLAWISATLVAGGSAPRTAPAVMIANPASSGAGRGMQALVVWVHTGTGPWGSRAGRSGPSEPVRSAEIRDEGRPGGGGDRPSGGRSLPPGLCGSRRAGSRAGQLREQLVPLAAAELLLITRQEGGPAALAQAPHQARVAGQMLEGRDESIDVAAIDGDPAAGRPDRVGRLAVSRADEDRGPARRHHAVELARHHDARHLGSHRDQMHVGHRPRPLALLP